MEGVLLIDKPTGLTSHDVVARVRKRLALRRVGHTGTLDPFASGLMVLCVGRATRLARFFSATAKTYIATVHFGYSTDTYDRTGQPVGEVRDAAPELSELKRRLASFLGRQMQVPPVYSAKKIGGTRLHRLARQGIAVTPSPVEVEFHTIELLALDGPRARIELSVSSGTYIRSLAQDLGRLLGTGAHLAELRRTRVGSFLVSEALDMTGLLEGAWTPAEALLPPNAALRDLSEVRLEPAAAKRLAHGRTPSWEEVTSPEDMRGVAGPVRVVDSGGELLAIAALDGERKLLRPVLVWARTPETP